MKLCYWVFVIMVMMGMFGVGMVQDWNVVLVYGLV